MKILQFDSFETFAQAPNALFSQLKGGALTIGNFDGLHLGHQAIFSRLKSFACQTALFTFTNHPKQILLQKEIPRIMTLEHRDELLKVWGLHHIIAIEFTKEFSMLSPEDFLTVLMRQLSFQHLVLGHDATIGHERMGNAKYLFPLAKKLQLNLEYVNPLSFQSEIVCSSTLRALIQNGELEKASHFLGRPYSIKSIVSKGMQQGARLGFKTANLELENICLPPIGVWAIAININQNKFYGVANLGYAPTLKNRKTPLLEVHLFDYDSELYDKTVEIFFLKHIRREKKFDSEAELVIQIKNDIEIAKAICAEIQ